MVRCFVPARHAAHATIACTAVALLVVSCENAGDNVDTRVAALVGEPIESIQQVQGVAPAPITLTYLPESEEIDKASFTIGLFDEDDATLCQNLNRGTCITDATPEFVTCACAIMGDLNPEHLFVNPLPAFDDVSIVEVAVNVGSAKAIHWDWDYKAYYQRPFGEFWVEVLDQNGATTTIVDKVGAPDGWGFRPFPHVDAAPAFTTGPQHVDLDLTPWTDQKISVRFVLHSNYDPFFFAIPCPPFGLCAVGSFDAGASKVYVSNVRVDTCSVMSVELEEINSPLDQNPGPLGGKRIFPEAKSPGDGTNRSGVNVVVRSQPNCKINLISLDVDDPSNDRTIDPNGLAGQDNSNDGTGDCGIWTNFSCEASVTTGADGVGRIEFRVTDLPGANFVIVAGKDVTKLRAITTSGTNVTGADGKEVPVSSRTPMLTVWRRLHIERDAMGPVVGNHASGRILSVTADPQCLDPSAPVGIRVNTALATPSLLDNFQFGRLIASGQSIPVHDSLVRTVCVPGSIASFRGLQGQTFTLYDDDDFNRNNGSLRRGDEGEAVRTPSTIMLRDSDVAIENVLAAAYIRPTYDIGGGTAPFLLNVPNYNNLAAHFAFNNAANNDADFWAVYLLGAYQGKQDRCNDPNGFRTTRGVSNKEGSMIFLESIADFGADAFGDEADVVAHEIGHLLCADHGEHGLMGGDLGGIESHEFTPESIAVIRKAMKWHRDGGCP